MRRLSSLFFCSVLAACSAGADKTSGVLSLDSGSTSSGTDSGGFNQGDAGTYEDVGNGLGNVDAALPETPAQGGQTFIYAHTDTELYSMDPKTQKLTDIGAFAGGSGSITDLAVNAKGDVWVNSETAIYTATLPAGGTGPVQLTLKTSLPSGSKFYALGFVPAGYLQADEALIAGDSAGSLYYIDTSGSSATPQNLGSFGSYQAGDPSPAKSGDLWTLSGDVVFYTDSGGAVRGLATLRSCYTSSSGSVSCSSKNDVLAEVDMNALKTAFTSKSPATSLRKQILGSGTGYGRLFGIGAWEQNVYAFSRASGTTTPAMLLQIGSNGAATVLQTFSSITAGWSGAGVTTTATITVLPPS